jgi:hypothetical protein
MVGAGVFFSGVPGGWIVPLLSVVGGHSGHQNLFNSPNAETHRFAQAMPATARKPIEQHRQIESRIRATY